MTMSQTSQSSTHPAATKIITRLTEEGFINQQGFDRLKKAETQVSEVLNEYLPNNNPNPNR
jgi:hypothetical protein